MKAAILNQQISELEKKLEELRAQKEAEEERFEALPEQDKFKESMQRAFL